MGEFLSFLHLGFRHIVNPDALDHILFLLALAAIYQGYNWRSSLWVISAFTVGHSMTLALAATGTALIPQRLTEFLIPVTVVATGLENILVRARERVAHSGRYRPLIAGVFGLVHGAGFAGYLQQLFLGSVAVPLFGFNLGIELGQVLVLAGIGAAFRGLDRLLSIRVLSATASPFQLRVITVSLVVVTIATDMAVARRPW